MSMVQMLGVCWRSCFVVNAGNVIINTATISAARVDSVREKKLAEYNLILSASVGASIMELRECVAMGGGLWSIYLVRSYSLV